MAQTTNQLSFAAAKVEFSTNGSSWTDVSGVANKIEVGGGDREIGQAFTGSADIAILATGKRAPLELKATIVYTENGGEAWESLVRPAYENGTALYFRWSPKGGSSTNFQFASAAGYVKSPIYPAGEYGPGDPIMAEVTLVTPSVTKSAVP